MHERAVEEPAPLGFSPNQHWLANAGHVDMSVPGLPVKRITLNAQPQQLSIDLNRTVLMVIDMQNDFVPRAAGLTTSASTSRPTARRSSR